MSPAVCPFLLSYAAISKRAHPEHSTQDSLLGLSSSVTLVAASTKHLTLSIFKMGGMPSFWVWKHCRTLYIYEWYICYSLASYLSLSPILGTENYRLLFTQEQCAICVLLIVQSHH